MSNNFTSVVFKDFKITFYDNNCAFIFVLNSLDQVSQALNFITISVLKIKPEEAFKILSGMSENDNENTEIYKNLKVSIPDPRDKDDFLLFSITKGKNQKQYFDQLKKMIVEYQQ